jgi:hypothetical protein
MSYIYVATSVLTFGAILFTHIRCTVKLWFFVNPERSLLAYAAILNPPPPLKEPSFYTSTNRPPWLAFIAADIRVPDTPRFIYCWDQTSECWNMKTDLQTTHKVFSISVQWRTVNAYSQTNFIHKNQCLQIQ